MGSAAGACRTRSLRATLVYRWWYWLINGAIRVPVPVGLLGVADPGAFDLLGRFRASAGLDRQARTVTLVDFEPVKQLQPRIIRSGL